MFLGNKMISFLGVRAFTTLLFERNFALDCNKMTKMSLEFSCILQSSALNDVRFLFWLLHLLVVFSIYHSNVLICTSYLAVCLLFAGDALDRRGRRHVVVICIVLYVIEDYSHTKGRIPDPALEACLGSR